MTWLAVPHELAVFLSACLTRTLHNFLAQLHNFFCYFQISAIPVHSCVSALTVLPFLSEWLFLKVGLVDATQLCLDHILSCAWVIYSVVLGS